MNKTNSSSTADRGSNEDAFLGGASPLIFRLAQRKRMNGTVVLLLVVLGMFWMLPSNTNGTEYLINPANVTMKREEENTSAALPPAPQAGSALLFIHVQDWSEGISHWTETLSQILVLSKSLNATLVEPGITHGRLVGRTRGNVLLSDIFNLTHLDKHGYQIASRSDFLQLVADNTATFTNEDEKSTTTTTTHRFDVCFLNSRPKTNICENNIANEFRHASSDVLEAAVQMAHHQQPPTQNHNNNLVVILQIHQLWDFGVTRLKMNSAILSGEEESSNTTTTTQVGDVLLVPKEQVKLVHDELLQFTNHMYKLADSALYDMGIAPLAEDDNQHDDFDHVVIHWRAERMGMDYMNCAKGLLRAKESILNANNTNIVSKDKTKFVLASSLSFDTQKIWAASLDAAGENTTAMDALAYLLLPQPQSSEGDTTTMATTTSTNVTPHFVSVNQVLKDTPDLIVNSVVDLIVAQRAKVFATCTRTCGNPYRYCRGCNYSGQYAGYIMQLRFAQAKPSMLCWPQHASNIAGILKLEPRNENLTWH